jgi:hypothetical protein
MPSLQQVLERLSPTEAPPGSGSGLPGTDVPGTDPAVPDISEAEIPEETTGADNPVPDATGTESRGPDASGPDITTTLIAGLVILFCILLISVMYTVAPALTGTGQNPGVQNAAAADSDISDSIQSNPITEVTATPVGISPTPVITPVIISSTPVPAPAAPASYVTIEANPFPSPPVLQDLTQDLPVPSTRDYVTIFSMDNQEAVTKMPYVSFNLVNPPLVIEYDITPLNITDVKEIDYKIISTYYHEVLHINRYYEHSWFTVIARDRDTGTVVAENGFGEKYSQDTHGRIAVYAAGNYRFEFSGQLTHVTLTMKVKKEGNIP